ncbi:MAG: lipoprotein insertase outer membrane protein LolB [Gammaproteobacteria bacterium]
MSPGGRMAAACVVAVWVAACGQLPSRPTLDAPGWSAPTWTDWELRGRIAVRTEADGWHASFTWRQIGETFQLDLSGPLGQGALRLRGDAAGVELERADGLRDAAPDAGALLRRHTGWALPVTGLRYWVRGLGVPGRPATWERNATGYPQRLRQDGWDIRYTDYRDQLGQGLLPRRVDLVRDGLRVRLLADSWHVVPPG